MIRPDSAWWWAPCTLQDIFGACFSPLTAREEGTLYHAKNRFSHRKVSGEVKKCMNNAVELVNMVTDGYVVGAAMQFMGTQTPQEQPDALPDDVHERQAYREAVINSVLDLSFHPPSMKHSLSAERAEEDCCCGEVTGEGMVECHSKGHCAGKGWYHLACIGLSRAPKGKWLCQACQEGEAGHDGKLEHSKVMLWIGLNDRLRHKAVRRNDGNSMVRHWRFDLSDFFVRGHPKYLMYCLRLLSNVSGAASPQLAHSLRWNRTVNTTGGPERNLEIDLYMEMLNRAYKESSRVSRGQLTSATVDRHSRMLAVNAKIDEVFDGNRCVRRKHGKPDRVGEVA